MIQKRPTLGRGLADLLGQSGAAQRAREVGRSSAEAPPGAGEPREEQLARLPLGMLERGRYQPRMDLRPETLEELAASIKAQGVVQPIVVRPLGEPAAGGAQRYEIIAGERRWRAAQMAGLTEIPAIVRRIPDEAAIAVALIENIQRENLNALEEARALDRLIREFRMTHQEAADAVGRSRAAVSNLLRLLDLAPEIADLLEQRRLEMGHARALLGLTGRRQQAEVGALVARKGLSVRETEALVRRMLAPARRAQAEGESATDGRARDADIERLERELGEKLGAKVAIRHSSSGQGRLVVDYNSLDELDGILAHFQ